LNCVLSKIKYKQTKKLKKNHKKKKKQNKIQKNEQTNKTKWKEKKLFCIFYSWKWMNPFLIWTFTKKMKEKRSSNYCKKQIHRLNCFMRRKIGYVQNLEQNETILNSSCDFFSLSDSLFSFHFVLFVCSLFCILFCFFFFLWFFFHFFVCLYFILLKTQFKSLFFFAIFVLLSLRMMDVADLKSSSSN